MGLMPCIKSRLVELRAGRWAGEKEIPLKICVVYAAVGISWVYFEHNFIEGGPSSGKDIFFILATSWLLYWLVEHDIYYELTRSATGGRHRDCRRFADVGYRIEHALKVKIPRGRGSEQPT